MSDKLDYYDIFSTLILGALLMIWSVYWFPDFAEAMLPPFPEAFIVIALTAIALFLGQLIQALASIAEPLLFRTFGGRPSDIILRGAAEHYLPLDACNRIKSKLNTAAPDSQSDHGLFLYAMHCIKKGDGERVGRFNSLYAYHRGLLVLVVGSGLVAITSLFARAEPVWSLFAYTGAAVAYLLVLLLVWYRTKQRAFYYVRTVLLEAERVIDERNPGSRR